MHRSQIAGQSQVATMSTAHWQACRLPIPAAWPVRSSRTAHQWAIVSAGLAPVLLTGAYLIAGIFQPASYSPVRKTISAMAGQAGTDRWVMTGGLFLVGGCYLVTAAGLTGVRAPARALLIVAGLAGIRIAASPEPARGATPRHLAWTTLGAITTALWPAFAAPRASPGPLILASAAPPPSPPSSSPCSAGCSSKPATAASWASATRENDRGSHSTPAQLQTARQGCEQVAVSA